MTLPTLLSQLESRAAFDERDSHDQAMKCGYNSNYPTQHKAFEYGSKSENARLSPIISALIAVVAEMDEALKRIDVQDDTNLDAPIAREARRSAAARLAKLINNQKENE
jgi:hypothetical protein